MERIRTIPEAVQEIKRLDGNTALTLRGVRRLVSEGTLTTINIGSKRLISLDKLLNLIEGQAQQAPPAPEYGVIRRID